MKKERGSRHRYDSNGESQEAVILHHLKALEGETAIFRGLIEELENEQVALKIKMDLWSVESKKIAIINLLDCVSFQLSAVLRIEVREEFSKDMVDVSLADMAKADEHLEAKQGQVVKAPTQQFSH